jgi:8-oxo-dGTP diphosphatase
MRDHRPDHAVLRLAVDLIILTVRLGRLHVLLVERDNVPFRGQLALPGGFMRDGEDPIGAAIRELREETDLDGSALYLEQLEVFGAPLRDPRGRVLSVPYLAIAPDLPLPHAGSDARDARWEPIENASHAGALAFDHGEILATALERARIQLERSTVAAAFCGEEFTISELRHVYEAVWGVSLDPGNFSRKVTKSDGFIVATDRRRVSEGGRPAALFRRGPAQRLHPPMLRSDSSPP